MSNDDQVSCYAIVALHLLHAMATEFGRLEPHTFVLPKDNDVLRTLCTVVDKLEPGVSLSPVEFAWAIRVKWPDLFHVGEHCDALELVTHILHEMVDGESNLFKHIGTSALGHSVQRVTCGKRFAKRSGHLTVTPAVFEMLDLHFPQSATADMSFDVEELFTHTFPAQGEALSDFRCDSCQKNMCATKTMEVVLPPRWLLIRFIRFTRVAVQGRRKDDSDERSKPSVRTMKVLSTVKVPSLFRGFRPVAAALHHGAGRAHGHWTCSRLAAGKTEEWWVLDDDKPPRKTTFAKAFGATFDGKEHAKLAGLLLRRA
jgi:hypothetical protein